MKDIPQPMGFEDSRAPQESAVTKSRTLKLNEFNHAEDPARRLLERLGWIYVPREALAAERSGER